MLLNSAFPGNVESRTYHSPVHRLPLELIEEVAYHARSWKHLPPPRAVKRVELHMESDDAEEDDSATSDNEDDTVMLPSDLAALTATCRRLRSVSTPVLLRDVSITSAKRLRSLSALPTDKLGQIHVLSLYMDADFFAEFARSLDSHFRTPQHINRSAVSPHLVFGTPPLIKVLCTIMISAAQLKSFSINLVKADARPSAWTHFSFRWRGIPLRRAFEECMREILFEHERTLHQRSSENSLQRSTSLGQGGELFKRFTWPKLTHIHLDTLEEIGPLLRMAPSLTHLSLRLLEGYDPGSCMTFLADLKSGLGDGAGNGLKGLKLSARSLHLPDRNAGPTLGVELVEELGKVCPKLEHLDLRVNVFSPDILPYQTVYNEASFSPLANAMSCFPRLRTIHLPAALWDEDELEVFFVMGPEADQSAQTERRRAALHLVAGRERDAMMAMGAVAPRLRHVSWVRNCHLDFKMDEFSVQYELRRKRSIYQTPEATSTLNETDDGHVPEVDHVYLSHIHHPPRVQEIPRRIGSPVSGPSFLGYARTSDGFSEFKADHPFAALVVLCLGVVGVFGMIGVQTFLRLPSLVGIVHTIYMKTFPAPIALLLIADLLSILSPSAQLQG